MWVLQGMYNGEWEDLTAEVSKEEVTKRKREYMSNEKGTYRIRYRRDE